MLPIIDIMNIENNNYSNFTIIVNAIEEEIGHLCKTFIYKNNSNKFIGGVLSPNRRVYDIPFDIVIELEPLTSEVRKYIRDFYNSRHILTSIDGNTEKIIYPYKGKNYNVSLIFTYTFSMFDNNASKKALKCVLSQFANSIGYHLDLDTNVLSIHMKNSFGKNIISNVASGMKNILKVLQLDDNIDILYTPDIFVKWILLSPRYYSCLFENSKPRYIENKYKESDEFTKKVYEILGELKIKGRTIPDRIDMQDDNFDFEKYIKIESSIVGKYIAEKIRKAYENIENNSEEIILTKTLKNLGYVPGPIYDEIIDSVSNEFTLNEKHSNVVKYILHHFPLEEQ